MSSRAPRLLTRNIEGFELCSFGGPCSQHPRPVVVLIGWLNARRKHLRKYQELYCGRGLDVLTMPVSPIHIVRPVSGITYTKKLLKVLQVGRGKKVIMTNFNRRNSHGHHGSKRHELVQHAHSHGSPAFTHTLTST